MRFVITGDHEGAVARKLMHATASLARWLQSRPPLDKTSETFCYKTHYRNVPTRRAVSLLLIAAAVVFGENGAGARYVGGTVSVIPSDSNGRIRTTDDVFFNFVAAHRDVSIGYDKINLLEYGQNVNRRLGLAITISPLFLLAKSRQHFLTVGYTDKDGKQQAMVFQVEKDKIRSVIVALEARTGLKVTYQDAQARKSGKV